MTVVVVGPYTVDASKCSHSTSGAHSCIHDWRINGANAGDYFGNVEKTGDQNSDGA